MTKENEPLLFEIVWVKFLPIPENTRGESKGIDVPEPILSLNAEEWVY